jgi:hypothetical protein
MMMTLRLRSFAIAAAVALIGIGTAAYAARVSGTTGTEMRFQQEALKMGAPAMVNATGTAASGAVTLNQAASGVITSEALTTAAGGDYTLTITDDAIAAADIVLASVQNGTNTTVEPAITTVAPAAGSVVIKVRNLHASSALNGTIKVSFLVIHTAALNAE